MLKQLLSEGVELKLVGYAISHLTGIDLEAEQLLPAQQDTDEDQEDLEDVDSQLFGDLRQATILEDDGLLEPCPDKLLLYLDNWQSKHISLGNQPPIIAGQTMHSIARNLYRNGTQPQRWQSAEYLLHIGEISGLVPSLWLPTVPPLKAA